MEVPGFMLGISMLFASFAAYRENKSTMCIVAFPVFLAFSIYPFVPEPSSIALRAYPC
ncbi:MAG: hypothetical protein AB7S83_03440 [Candidatus Methanomethylophilaceae archaeon]